MRSLETSQEFCEHFRSNLVLSLARREEPRNWKSEPRELLAQSKVLGPHCDINDPDNCGINGFHCLEVKSITRSCKIDKNTCTDLLELMV